MLLSLSSCNTICRKCLSIAEGKLRAISLFSLLKEKKKMKKRYLTDVSLLIYAISFDIQGLKRVTHVWNDVC